MLRRYKFNLINLCKDDSLYCDGMQPLVHSAREEAASGLGWHREGEKIAYYTNGIRRGRGKRCVCVHRCLCLLMMACCFPW